MKTKKVGESARLAKVESMHGHPIIRQIVDRQHTMTPYCRVLREVIGKMTTPWKQLPRPTRAGIWQEVVRVHKANRRLYIQVVTGRF